MNLKISASLIILLFLSIALAAQTGQRKSIRQIEWEAHRHDKPLPRLPGEPEKARPLVLRSSKAGKEVLGYLPYWEYNNYPLLNYDQLTTIAYFGIEVDGQGSISNQRQYPIVGLIDQAHSQGVRVVLTVILFNSNAIGTLLGSTTNRTALRNNLLALVTNAGADGISIDFEGVPAAQRQNMVTLMTDLTNSFRTSIPGTSVTIFTPAIDWSDAWDYNALANACDGLLIQGYDYHWSGSPTAGPVAPLTGTRWGNYNITWSLQDYMLKTGNNSAKLLLTIPFFGREWPTVDASLGSQTTASGSTILYDVASDNAAQRGRLWDVESQTPWYAYNDGQWHQGWYDDSLSIARKLAVVNSMNLQGIGIWALGYDGDRPELQQAIDDAFSDTTGGGIPDNFELAQNYPNPFNQQTTIRFGLTRDSSKPVQLAVYDIRGRRVATLVNDRLPAGEYRPVWEGLNSAGEAVASGIYLYRLITDEGTRVRKMALIR